MSYEKDKKQLLITIISVVIPFLVYKVIASTLLPAIEDNILKTFIGECVFSGATVVAAIFAKKIWALKFNGKGLGKGFLVGWPMFAVAIFGILAWLGNFAMGNVNVTVSGGKVVMLLIAALLVGISEELLIRGILINGLTDYFGTITPSVIRKAVIISAVVFGALHLFNVFSGVTVLAAFIQAVNAAFMGILFGAIYFRNGKNLWPCIIIHAIWDFNGFINGGMLTGGGTDDAINTANFSMLILSGILMLYALFLLRNKKLETVENVD